MPEFEYIYNDLGTLTDIQAEALNDKFLAASMLALKHSFEKEWIENNAVQLLVLAAEGPKSLQKGFIIYLYSRGRLEEKILNSLPEPIKKTIMNTLDIYIEKGRKAGIEEGIERGKEEEVRNLILKLGLTDKQVTEVAEISMTFVKKVRASLKKKKQE